MFTTPRDMPVKNVDTKLERPTAVLIKFTSTKIPAGWTKVILHPAGMAKSAKRASTLKKNTRKEALVAH